MTEPPPQASPSVTFVAAKTRIVVLALVLLLAAALLIAIGHADRDTALLYFFGYPCAVLGLGGTVFFLLRKPARLIVGSDFVIINGQRYAAADIVVGEPEYQQRGEVSFRVFSLTTVGDDGKMHELEINALAWPQFERMHARLKALTQASRRSI